jgi:hypothetical protein
MCALITLSNDAKLDLAPNGVYCMIVKWNAKDVTTVTILLIILFIFLFDCGVVFWAFSQTPGICIGG